MITASRMRNAAAANSAAPIPPARTLTFTSDFASAISLRISVETSRLAEATSWPIEGSGSGRTTVDPVVGAGALSVIGTPFGGAEPRRNRSGPGAHPASQHQRCERCGDQRTNQYGGLRVLGLAMTEGELAHQQRHREADAGQEPDTQEVAPGQLGAERSARQPGGQPGPAEH